MGFETSLYLYRYNSSQLYHESIPMGFETLSPSSDKFIRIIMRASLWDLKHLIRVTSENKTEIMRASLWDLKLDDTNIAVENGVRS